MLRAPGLHQPAGHTRPATADEISAIRSLGLLSFLVEWQALKGSQQNIAALHPPYFSNFVTGSKFFHIPTTEK